MPIRKILGGKLWKFRIQQRQWSLLISDFHRIRDYERRRNPNFRLYARLHRPFRRRGGAGRVRVCKRGCNRWHIPSRSRSTLDDVRFHAAPSLLTLPPTTKGPFLAHPFIPLSSLSLTPLPPRLKSSPEEFSFVLLDRGRVACPAIRLAIKLPRAACTVRNRNCIFLGGKPRRKFTASERR